MLLSVYGKNNVTALSADNLPGLLALVSSRFPNHRAELTGLTITALNGAFATFAMGRIGVHTGLSWVGIPVSAVSMLLFAVLI